MSMQRHTLIILPFLSSLLMITMATAHHDESCMQENSYLWKVDTEPPMYLFGTIHVPYTKLWDGIPGNAKVAFSSCDEVCLELVLSDQTTREELAKCQKLPGRYNSIEELLSEEMVDRIERYFESVKRVFPQWLNEGSSLLGGSDSDAVFKAITSDWKKKRPIWILVLINSLTKERVQSRNIPVLDLFMDNVAHGLGKQVQAMETARDHCRPLNKIPNDKVELALRVQLDHLEVQLSENNLHGNQASDIHTYRCGDFTNLVLNSPLLPIPPLENITVTSPNVTANETAALLSVEETLYYYMVTKRNRKMSNSIQGLLQSKRNKTMFIALGAGHFLSEFNVLDRLVKKGHRIEHILAHTTIEGPTLPSNTIQLGDPNTRLRSLEPTEEGASSHDLPTLSPESLDRIWSRIQNRSLNGQPETPTEQKGNHLTVRHAPLLTDSTGLEQSTPKEESPTSQNSHSSSSSQSGSSTHVSPEDKWSQEVNELFFYPDQTGSGSNSILLNSQATSITLLLVTVLALCLW